MPHAPQLPAGPPSTSAHSAGSLPSPSLGKPSPLAQGVSLPAPPPLSHHLSAFPSILQSSVPHHLSLYFVSAAQCLDLPPLTPGRFTLYPDCVRTTPGPQHNGTLHPHRSHLPTPLTYPCPVGLPATLSSPLRARVPVHGTCPTQQWGWDHSSALSLCQVLSESLTCLVPVHPTPGWEMAFILPPQKMESPRHQVW